MTTETQTPETTTTERTERTEIRKPRLLGKPYFRRKKSCVFSGENAPAIDYKDTRTLGRYVSPYGKMLPSHITGVSNKKQRQLSTAIKRSRHLALMPYVSR